MLNSSHGQCQLLSPPRAKPAGLLQASLNSRAVFVTRRVEEVNWAAWEKTLPTLSEDPSGAGIAGEWPRGCDLCPGSCEHALWVCWQNGL